MVRCASKTLKIFQRFREFLQRIREFLRGIFFRDLGAEHEFCVTKRYTDSNESCADDKSFVQRKIGKITRVCGAPRAKLEKMLQPIRMLSTQILRKCTAERVIFLPSNAHLTQPVAADLF